MVTVQPKKILHSLRFFVLRTIASLGSIAKRRVIRIVKPVCDFMRIGVDIVPDNHVIVVQCPVLETLTLTVYIQPDFLPFVNSLSAYPPRRDGA